MTYQDEGVGFPVSGSNLVSKPGGDCFGRFDTEFRHRLRDVFNSIQQPLGSVVVVLQKTIRLKRSQEISRVKRDKNSQQSFCGAYVENCDRTVTLNYETLF